MKAGRLDGAGLITVYAVFLFAIPSRLTVGALGGAGSPAMVIGLGFAVLWVAFQIQREPSPTTGANPVRRAGVGLLVAFAISYVVAMMRAIDPAEVKAADLGLVVLFSWLGTLLFAHDCVPSVDRLRVVCDRLVLGAGGVAAVGVLQWLTGQTLIDKIRIPGLSANSPFFQLTVREGFNRPTGTALHPIEFGAVLTMLIPLAIARALASPDEHRGMVRRWGPVVVLVMGVSLSISRSAILGLVVGVVVFAFVLSRRVAATLAAGGLVFVVLLFLTVPGLLGTMLGLFTNAGDDSSVASRTSSYGLALEFFARSPLFGRGFGTFLPSYRIFDDQYLLSLVDVGLVGLVAIVGLFAAAGVVARRSRRLFVGGDEKLMAQGLFAGVSVGASGLLIYDGFSFPMGAGLLFLLIGLSGCAYRLARASAAAQRQERAGPALYTTGPNKVDHSG
ncbi:MAG: hypothetical protein JWO46_3118 [Nocardioidaceae bacterium]|nr:hypothetical protein [Nocardioidaceae bacterium]